MNYTKYNPDTGEIISTLTIMDDSLTNENLQNSSYIPGLYQSSEYYIGNNEPVKKPEDPSTSIIKYQFNYATKQYELNQERSSYLTREYRNKLLSQIDRVNPVWYSALTAEQQAELVAYRQHLLDVPGQSGFPAEVAWPAKPEWL